MAGQPTLDVPEATSPILSRSELDASFRVGFASSKVKIPYSALQHLLALFDAALLFFRASWVVVSIRSSQMVIHNLNQLLGAGIIAALLYVLVGQSSGFYDLRVAFSKRKKDAGRILAQWLLLLFC